MVNVSWNDAVAFCKWLSKKEGKTYRLPTEAEWEYACRAGTTTRYYSGDDPETLAKVGNVADAALKAKFPDWKYTIKANDGYVFTAPVGKFKPNAFGLYDMHGNAWQWCADWYGADYYATSPLDDPTGPDSGDAPCPSRRFLERQAGQRAFRQSRRMLPGRPERRHRLPRCQDSSSAMRSCLVTVCGATLLPIENNKPHAKPPAQRSFLCAFAALRETSTAARSIRPSPASACTLHALPSCAGIMLAVVAAWLQLEGSGRGVNEAVRALFVPVRRSFASVQRANASRQRSIAALASVVYLFPSIVRLVATAVYLPASIVRLVPTRVCLLPSAVCVGHTTDWGNLLAKEKRFLAKAGSGVGKQNSCLPKVRTPLAGESRFLAKGESFPAK